MAAALNSKLSTFAQLAQYLGMNQAELEALGYISKAEKFLAQIEVEDCVAIYGRWGSGKTTFFDCASHMLDSKKYHIVRKSVFSFGNITEFMNEVLSDVGIFVEKRTGKRALGYFANILQRTSPQEAQLEASFFFAKLSSRSTFRLSSYLHRDSNYYKSMVEKLLANLDRQIVLFIDDIDRLTPDEVPYILRFIELLKGYPNMRIVMAVDRRSLESLLIESRLANPKKYIEKIVDSDVNMDVDAYVLLKLICDKQEFRSSKKKSYLRKALIFELARHKFITNLDNALENELKLNMYNSNDMDKRNLFSGVLSDALIVRKMKNKFDALNNSHMNRLAPNIWTVGKGRKTVYDIDHNIILRAFSLLSADDMKSRLVNFMDSSRAVPALYETVALRTEKDQNVDFSQLDRLSSSPISFQNPVVVKGRVIDLLLDPRIEDIQADFNPIITPRLAIKIAKKLKHTKVAEQKSAQLIHTEVARIVNYEI